MTKPKNQNKYIVFSSMTFQMAATIGFFVWLGLKLDSWLKTNSIFTAILSLLGVGVSIYQIIKTLKNLND
jgi:F0F1-type ATP synthase assembly protein I